MFARTRSSAAALLLAVASAATFACSKEPGERPERPIVVEDAGPVTPAASEIDSVAPEVADAPAAPPEVVLVPEEEIPIDPAPSESAQVELDRGADAREPEETAVEDEDGRTPAEDAGTGPRVVPAGTTVDAELRTPFHSATTRVGDRFAARTREPIEVDGRTVVAANTLVEGRVVRVASAEGPEGRGLVELDLTSIVLPSGGRVPLEAEVAAVEPRKVATGRARSKAEGAVVGAGAGGAAGAVLGGSRKATAIGAILGGVAGAVLVSGEPDHELIVPSGTILTITVETPLEIPNAVR